MARHDFAGAYRVVDLTTHCWTKSKPCSAPGMNALSDLHQRIDERVTSVRKAHPDWLCARCDTCCRQLAALPQLTRGMEWLREGLATLPSAQLTEIHRRIATPGLDTTANGDLPAARSGQRGLPDLCPPAGRLPHLRLYVQRDKGLHCARIAAQVERGELAEVIWGNHLAVEDDPARLGEVRSLADWFSAVSPIGDEDAEAPTPERHPRK